MWLLFWEKRSSIAWRYFARTPFSFSSRQITDADHCRFYLVCHKIFTKTNSNTKFYQITLKNNCSGNAIKECVYYCRRAKQKWRKKTLKVRYLDLHDRMLWQDKTVIRSMLAKALIVCPPWGNVIICLKRQIRRDRIRKLQHQIDT